MRQRFFLFSLILFVISILLVGIGIGKVLSAKTNKPPPSPSPGVSPSFLPEPSVASSSAQHLLVTRVIDGDTIELSSGEKVRYIGIDTPETVSPNTPIECFGTSASDKNKELVLGKEVRLEKDISETDKYKRLLRYVYVETEGTEIMVNEYLVAEGFANSSTYPPDVKYQERLKVAAESARAQSKGLWAVCASGVPQTSTTTEVNAQVMAVETTQESVSGCIIKGNISASGDKIFHAKGCGSYEKTVIDETAGERWFCSESEAVSAGWRKAKNC